ncbi:17ef9a2c-dd50-4640-aba5-11f20fd69162 [Sclerotinia trifoliorum]|uniref:17ef9a2c-dd50-4640-aba5-11f20fd69162 n=1 Tax=Sclerotinia trifoliorum TaxID=28548 RepID=A0A8H2W3V3_9HELO|nr:17ef9a2c-dd50-4640-aba5-11f20fd69162 [Sclerotinia trifoliorum]
MATEHPYAPWRRLILVPCWIIQVLLSGFTLVINAVAVAQFMRDDSGDDDDYNGDFKTSFGIAWFYIVFSSVYIILTITEIILMLRHKLKPIMFLNMNILKSTSSTILFIISCWNAFGIFKKIMPSFVGLIIHIILLLAFYIPLTHGSLIMRRNLKAAKYEPVDPKHASYDSTTEPFPDTFPDTFPQIYKAFTTVVEITDLEANNQTPERPRRLSYNHTRDTRFDSYKQTRRSFSDPSVMRSMAASPPGFGALTPVSRSRSGTWSLPIPQVVVNDYDAPSETNARPELR